ncbi:[methyl-Co(III) methanol-specific corrinoid protein]:coenzyme M methyltransferase [Candidatus Hakubella thermalkaliphila]|uniref:[methyl-Co(III) methanol-specific corrinoid protein]:coenzyme M methyltransferase n=2 Tax=Candidatus Hakubella thermalkaliphila TaxID=2754717 RepID=A0A6V8NL62_9ACTN|nr:[methyl-Co(III) methanol-specific corrinoid protein]:coenzyme M methyltransferase [Candidatus Hakubella thermalkaliphila]
MKIVSFSRERGAPEGTVVLGVMDGPWTIGSRIVAAVLETHDFKVVHAGSDIASEHMVTQAVAARADVVAVGSYLSYKLNQVKELDERLAKAGLRNKIRLILSGPAGSKRVAEEYGADSYARDAEEVLEQCRAFMSGKKAEMTARRRVMTALELQPPDGVSLVAFSMTFSAKHADIEFSDYVSQAEAMAEAEIKACRRFGWDNVCNSTDVAIFAQSVGAEVYMPEDDIPRIIKPAIYPFDKELFKRITDYGAPVLIHCCGNVPQCIPFAPAVNPGGAIQFDYQVKLKWAKELIGDKMTIMSNLDCNQVLQLGLKEDVLEARRRAIQDAAPGGGFWLSGGCEIPRDMPYENMEAMLKAIKEYGRYPIVTESMS